jgi:hypothetical protein
VRFTTPDPVKYPVPSKTYLDIQAACAKLAHLSGVRKFIDKFSDDLEVGTPLDPDGGSADLLEHAMLRLLVSVTRYYFYTIPECFCVAYSKFIFYLLTRSKRVTLLDCLRGEN